MSSPPDRPAGALHAEPARLQADLDAAGLPLSAVADGGLALLTPTDAAWTPGPEHREWLIARARAAGFTHVALVLPDDADPDEAGPTDTTTHPAEPHASGSIRPGPPRPR